MLKKPITYTDYDGVERKEDFYFSLNKAELMEMNLMEEGGMQNKIEKIVAARNTPELVKLFKKVIVASYGEKSDDGKRFIKSEKLTEEFLQTEAYSNLFMELLSDEVQMTAFIRGIIPSDISAAVEEKAASKIEEFKQKANIAALDKKPEVEE